MAEGRIIVFREDRNNRSRHYGYIVDAALGQGCDRELTVYFDERDLVGCDPSQIDAPHTRVGFEYGIRGVGRNPRARHVRLLPMPETLGRVVKVKPNDRGYYGFLHADGETRDYYFTDRSVINCDVPLLVGARVRFWYDNGRLNERAYRVELVEEE
ncbi:hypothetical protein ACVWZ4_001365 [Bradyrhizobium sp. USDA 4472]